MFILDDILLLPLRGLLRVGREVANAVDQELQNDEEQVKDRLRELYMQLETGQISEEAFEAGEGELLDELDRIAARGREEDENDGAEEDENDGLEEDESDGTEEDAP